MQATFVQCARLVFRDRLALRVEYLGGAVIGPALAKHHTRAGDLHRQGMHARLLVTEPRPCVSWTHVNSARKGTSVEKGGYRQNPICRKGHTKWLTLPNWLAQTRTEFLHK